MLTKKVCAWVEKTIKDETLPTKKREYGPGMLNIERIIEGTYDPHTDYE